MPRDRQLSPRHCGKIEGLKECGLGERKAGFTIWKRLSVASRGSGRRRVASHASTIHNVNFSASQMSVHVFLNDHSR